MNATGDSVDSVSLLAMTHPLPIVYIVDDDISVREALEQWIRQAGWESQTFTSAQNFLDSPRIPVPSCLVLDFSLPGLNGLEVQKRAAVERPEMPIIFITGHGDIPISVQAMKGGAVEFFTKPVAEEVLLAAVRNAIERSQNLLGRETERRILQSRYTSLTSRERQVMAMVVSGLLNKQVAGELKISEITVKAHRRRAMRKMKAGSFADLVRMAARLRIQRSLGTKASIPE